MRVFIQKKILVIGAGILILVIGIGIGLGLGQYQSSSSATSTIFGLIGTLVKLVKDEVKDSALIKVTRVIDGDTIEIEGGERVRYIGIDTPETVDTTKDYKGVLCRRYLCNNGG